MKKFLAIASFLLLFAIRPSVISAQDCSGSLPTRLDIGMSSQVKPGYTLVLRTAPETGSVLAELPAGTEFRITGAAVCGPQDGLRWWEIEWNGKTGYIPEGDRSDTWITQPPAMFMMPGSDIQEPTATSIPPTPSSGIVFNDLHFVREADGIRFTVDVSVSGYGHRALGLYLWFVDAATSDYIKNPDATPDYVDSSGDLFLSYDLKPCCDSFDSGQIQMFIPYEEFPDSEYSFYPQLAIYDENLTLLDEQSYADTTIAYSSSQTNTASIHSLDYQYADEGVRFLVDLTVHNRVNQDLTVNLWLIDNATGDYVQNPLADVAYRDTADDLVTSADLQPISANQQYTGTDLVLYIPYDEFPRGDYNYSPFVTVNDASLKEIARHQFTDKSISSADHPFPASGILIRDVEPQFDQAGVHFLVDFDAKGYSGQKLKLSTFFNDYSDQYIKSALPLPNYYVDSTGSIATDEVVTPCCDAIQSFTGDNRVDLYVPYNVFPVGTYSYYPSIGVSLDGATENLEWRVFKDRQIQVLGDQPPAGYIVNFKIDSLYGAHPLNAFRMANTGRDWDNLLLTYGLNEVDASGETIPGGPHYWAHEVPWGPTYTDGFDTILLDVLASSNLVVRMDFVDVANMDATKKMIDQLRQGGDAAEAGAEFLPRLFRVAAGAAGRYVNGWLWIYEIQDLLRKDIPFANYEHTISAARMFALYQQTGAIGDRNQWFTEDVKVGGINDEYQYDLTLSYWLYGYDKQEEAAH